MRERVSQVSRARFQEQKVAEATRKLYEEEMEEEEEEEMSDGDTTGECEIRKMSVQSNLSYLGALGLGGIRNSDLSVSQNTI